MKRDSPGGLDRFRLRIRKALGMHVILCDGCQWNWRSACSRRERPNATWCPDYKKKGK
jgi:hypothetical protein